MENAELAWLVAASLGGFLAAVVGAWAKDQIERIGRNEQREDQREEKQADRAIDQTQVITKLQTQVDMLLEERKRCDDLIERMARVESFQGWAEPLLQRAVDGLTKAVEFEARFEERLITLFKGFDAMTRRMDRAMAGIAPLAATGASAPH